MSKYNCDETHDELQDSVDYFRKVPHRCDDRCWERSYEEMQTVVDRYTRLLVRSLKGRH